MKEQLPAPDFNHFQYERPNQKWVCGRAREGEPCRVGPDCHGHCRAAWECQPALETRPGETKGRFRCSRPAEYGGPCATGPLPDGTCARPVPKCVPRRSMRAQRSVFTLCVAIATIGVLLVGLCGPYRWRFIRPGALSAQHSTATFARLAGKQGNCAVCHRAAERGISTWLQAGLGADPGPFQFKALAAAGSPGMTALDRNCLQCHAGHSFHQPNVVGEHSCSDCHVEHEGPGIMPSPTDAQCRSCHADTAVMQASLGLGKRLPAGAFDYRPAQGRVLFRTPRPEDGFTRTLHSFATDHPEFQVIERKMRDPDTLKFNHQLHLTSSNVAALKKRKLACADCHQPDAAGVYLLRISYAQNCAGCHSLQFDVRNPGLLVPHGDAAHVRAFLRSLPQQYADYASRKPGIAGSSTPQSFAQEQVAQLRADFGSGEELERRVFFSDARRAQGAKTSGSAGVGAAIFPGCAYCHEVRSAGDAAPQVTAPVIPDRWLIRASFDHSKHFKTACTTCHQVERSRDTADILLPSKQTCVQCHSPQGGVANTCSTCHGYHSPHKDRTAVTAMGKAE